MLKSITPQVAGVLWGCLIGISGPIAAVAGPVSVVAARTISPNDWAASEVRYRRPAVRRGGGAGPDAVLGLFGAVLGGVIANQNYNNYSDYSYGAPQEYGYAPGYNYAPPYQGRARLGYGGSGGGRAAFSRGARGGGAPRLGVGHPGRR